MNSERELLKPYPNIFAALALFDGYKRYEGPDYIIQKDSWKNTKSLGERRRASIIAAIEVLLKDTKTSWNISPEFLDKLKILINKDFSKILEVGKMKFIIIPAGNDVCDPVVIDLVKIRGDLGRLLVNVSQEYYPPNVSLKLGELIMTANNYAFNEQ